MKTAVRFVSIGRNKASWVEELELDDNPAHREEDIRDAVLRKRWNGLKVLMSSVSVSCVEHEHGKSGAVYAGERPVGMWEILEPATELR